MAWNLVGDNPLPGLEMSMISSTKKKKKER